jgi:hypothetical protein
MVGNARRNNVSGNVTVVVQAHRVLPAAVFQLSGKMDRSKQYSDRVRLCPQHSYVVL